MIKAAIFDMDGLLIDSERLWQEAEIKCLGEVGVRLDREMCLETTGLRNDEVVEHWHRKFPWERPSKSQVERNILATFTELLRAGGEPKEGVGHVMSLVRTLGLKTALASSSPYAIISTTLERLGLGSAFDCVYSGQEEPYGKPHPGIYLTAAGRLRVPPEECLVFEDSLNGVIAAKAAKMKCAAVPEEFARHDRRFVIADVTLTSLAEFDEETWARLNAGLRTCRAGPPRVRP